MYNSRIYARKTLWNHGRVIRGRLTATGRCKPTRPPSAEPRRQKRGSLFFFLKLSSGEKEETLKINFWRKVYIFINYPLARAYKGVSVILLLEQKIAYKTAREFMCVKNILYT